MDWLEWADHAAEDFPPDDVEVCETCGRVTPERDLCPACGDDEEEQAAA